MISSPYLQRAAAVAIDIVCAALPLWLVAPVALIFWSEGANAQLAALTMINANAALALALYFIGQFVQMARGRRTPGRRLFKLDVVGEDGEVLGVWWSLLRELLGAAFVLACLFSGLYPLLLLLPLSALLDSNGRNVIDCLLRTRVQVPASTQVLLETDETHPATS